MCVCIYIYIYIFFLLALCYSYIHSNLNYANLAWGSTCRSNLKTIRNQQKHAIWIVHNKTKFEKQTHFLNQQMYWIYKDLNFAVLMWKVYTKTFPLF